MCRAVVILFKFKYTWKMKIRKYGADPYIRNIQCLRNVFTLQAVKSQY